ncbi:MAG: type II secretion system F family protein [Tepidiformaceae bacterium]
MELLVAFSTFVTVTLVVFGFLHQPASGAMDTRLGGLRYTRPTREALPDPDAAFMARVIAPITRSVVRRVARMLPSSMSDRLEGSIAQAGLKFKPGQFILVVGIIVGVLPMAATLYMASTGATGIKLLFTFAVMAGFSIYGPRIWLMGKVKRRRKEIWRALPDAFDLITASVEAGLGIDAAFNRVIEKVHGPFGEELTRTMREITMGRSRREAFLDMTDRTGVEELRSLVNAIIQAESMGISIGGVIRVQTEVIRVKRRQRAEEQAFKAPIKMVFPLVFFIFPSIMMVIGGPAVIQMKDAF